MEGCGFRRVARIMSKIYRYQTVINRIKKAGLKVLKEMSKVKMTELHEVALGKASVLRKLIDKII